MRSELEILAVVWTIKYFHCYVLGRHFVAKTDHVALTYLKKFADSNTRLMRWSLKLAGFNFSVEHRPGKKIPHADALSRYVGTVLNDENLNPGLFRLEQARDKFCKNLKTGTYTDKCEFFLDDIGLIYRRGTDDKHQLLVPESLIKDVIKQNHDPVYICHPGVKSTCDLIALSFWWPGMRKSIEDDVKTCDACQRIRDGREFKAPLSKVETPTAPFQVTSMDFTLPFPLTQLRKPLHFKFC